MPDRATKNTRLPHRMTAGQYAGTLITQVPEGYLRTVVRRGLSEQQHAVLELERRGCFESRVDVTAHAVNRASQRLLKVWRKTRNGDEGIYAWLARMSERAILHHGKADGRLSLDGVVYDFISTCGVPTLRSVWRDDHANRGRR